jgi:hypothetical protein
MFPTNPVAFWHYFDFITIAVLTIVMTALMKAHHRKTGSLLGSISETVAYSKISSTIFSVTMSILFPLYYAFVWFWVLPLIHASRGFYYLLIFSALCEMVFVWAPATVGKSKRIHGTMVSVVVVAMYLLTLLILLHGVNIGIAARISLSLSLACPFLIGILMTIKKFRMYTFLYEVICCVTFLISISLIAHA